VDLTFGRRSGKASALLGEDRRDLHSELSEIASELPVHSRRQIRRRDAIRDFSFVSSCLTDLISILGAPSPRLSLVVEMIVPENH